VAYGFAQRNKIVCKLEIYHIPVTGSFPTLITPLLPGYLHALSPDEKTLAYCTNCQGNFGIYTIPAEGGVETRLTTAGGLDDGPEFYPCGKYIWFNSVSSWLMQIWRINNPVLK
jgi:hypothetical protein